MWTFKKFAPKNKLYGGRGRKTREILPNSARNWPGRLRGEIIFGNAKKCRKWGERKKPLGGTDPFSENGRARIKRGFRTKEIGAG